MNRPHKLFSAAAKGLLCALLAALLLPAGASPAERPGALAVYF